jgi:DNA-binding LytR/AlgR family response regulator
MSYYGRTSGWQDVLTIWLICAYAWAVLTPPALWLYRRFPFAIKNWFRFLYIHLPAAAFLALVHLALFTTARQLLLPNSAGWITNYENIFVEAFHADVLIYFSILAVNYGFRYLFRRNSFETSAKNIAEPTTETLNVNGSNAEIAVYPERLSVKERGRIILVEVSQIDRVTSEGNYVKLHTKNKAYLLRETMNAMEQKLDPNVFVRLRRSTIVRIEHIAELHPLFNGEFEVVLKTGVKHLSSRRYRKNLESVLGP